MRIEENHRYSRSTATSQSDVNPLNPNVMEVNVNGTDARIFENMELLEVYDEYTEKFDYWTVDDSSNKVKDEFHTCIYDINKDLCCSDDRDEVKGWQGNKITDLINSYYEKGSWDGQESQEIDAEIAKLDSWSCYEEFGKEYCWTETFYSFDFECPRMDKPQYCLRSAHDQGANKRTANPVDPADPADQADPADENQYPICCTKNILIYYLLQSKECVSNCEKLKGKPEQMYHIRSPFFEKDVGFDFKMKECYNLSQYLGAIIGGAVGGIILVGCCCFCCCKGKCCKAKANKNSASA